MAQASPLLGKLISCALCVFDFLSVSFLRKGLRNVVIFWFESLMLFSLFNSFPWKKDTRASVRLKQSVVANVLTRRRSAQSLKLLEAPRAWRRGGSILSAYRLFCMQKDKSSIFSRLMTWRILWNLSRYSADTFARRLLVPHNHFFSSR